MMFSNLLDMKMKKVKLRKTSSQIIEGFKKVHGERYDYSKVEYAGVNSKVCIICKNHGEFWQFPRRHKAGNNCPKCARELVIRTRRKINLTQEEFLKRSLDRHGSKYDYSKSIFVNTNDKVCIICPIHGEFWQSPRHHFRSNGCYECGRKSTSSKNRKSISKKTFIKISKNNQLETYDYSLIPEIIPTGSTKVKIICPEHGVFEQIARFHMKGTGCNKCCYRGYERQDYINHCIKYGYEKVLVYLINIYNDSESFYKIGITCRTVKERFRKLKHKTGYSYKVINIKQLPPDKAWDLELYIKRRYKSYKYKPVIRFTGHSECFKKC